MLKIFYMQLPYVDWLVYESYFWILTPIAQVGSDSYQGAGAPTMFQAIRRIVGSLAHEHVSETSFERTIRQSFLGKL